MNMHSVLQVALHLALGTSVDSGPHELSVSKTGCCEIPKLYCLCVFRFVFIAAADIGYPNQSMFGIS